MNKENLLQAFGEIDEEIFGADFDNPEEAVKPVFVTPQKVRKSKKPFFIAASAVAACGTLVLGIGLASRENPTPQAAAYNISKIFPDIKFEESYKEIYNAEDLYQVQRTKIDLAAVKKYGNPSLIDGDNIYFTTSVDPFDYYNHKEEAPSTADIVLFNNSTGEEKVIYSTADAISAEEAINSLPQIYPAGIYNSYLYFFQKENDVSDKSSEFCRLNLQDYSSEVIFTYNGSFNYPVLSNWENCLYIGMEEIIEDKAFDRIYRYDLSDGNMDMFMENALELMPYKDGIVYTKGSDIYYHSPYESSDRVLFSDEFIDKKAYGGDFFLYYRNTNSTENAPTKRVLGIKDEKGDKALITETDIFLYDTKGSADGLVLFGEQDKPLLYDQRKDKFSFIEMDRDFYTFSPLGFGSGDQVSFLEFKYEGSEKQYTSMELVTIRRKGENTDNSKEDNKLIELPSAEELYDVRKYDFYSAEGDFNELNLETAVYALKNEVYFGRVWLYDFKLFVTDGVNVLSEEITGIHPTHAQIYAYSLDNKERTLILEEAPDNEENGLSLQIAGIFDDIVYYYKIERSGADGPQKISLYSFDMDSGERLKIFDLEADYDFKLEPIVKTKEYAYDEESGLTGTGTAEYIYFVDNGLTATSSEDDHAKIYKYNIQSKEVEIFKDKAIDPNICSYKDGIIYYSLGQYCRIYDEKGDRDLEKSDISSKIATAGNTIFFARREGYGEFNTLLGIYDDNLNPRELAVMPSYTLLAVNDNFAKEGGRGLTYLDIQFTSRELAEKPEGFVQVWSVPDSDLRADKDIYEALIYDNEKDCFSVLELTGGQRVVYAGKIDEGLILFTANEDYSQVEYYIIAKGSDVGEAGDEVVEER